MVTDGREAKQSQREPSRNSTECQKHLIAAQERLKGYICSTLLLVGFSAWTGNLTPAGVRGSASHCCNTGCFMSKKICSTAMQIVCISVTYSYFLTNLFSCTHWQRHMPTHTASVWGKSQINVMKKELCSCFGDPISNNIDIKMYHSDSKKLWEQYSVTVCHQYN